jgi:hypothetical protein
LVLLENIDGMYSLSIATGKKLLIKESSPNFNQTFIYNQLLKALCHEKGISKENCKISDLGMEENYLKEKSSILFIDLTYTLANEKIEEGQKIADISLSKEAIANINFKKLPNSTKQLDEKKEEIISFTLNGKTYNLTDSNVKIYVEKRFFSDRLFANIPEPIIIESCTLVFENGFIASIIASGTLNGKPVKFSNKYSIGVTTRTNIQDFTKIKLYDELRNTGIFIYLCDLIEYSRIIDVYTRDYCPMDGKVYLTSSEPEKTVYKSPNAKLFRLNFYSDFVGINEDNPNGLVQIELNKRINLWTKRVYKASLFTFLMPYFEWSKIEQHNRSLQFSNATGINYVSPLEVYRYSTVESGILWNIVEGDGSIINAQINFFPALTFTNLKDSVNQIGGGMSYINERINSLILGSEFKLSFSPEKSWNFAVSSRPFYYLNMNAAIPYKSLKENVTEKKLETPRRLLNDLSLLITLRTGAEHDNLFFARLGFIHEFANMNNNFAQLQLGYSMYLKTATKK